MSTRPYRRLLIAALAVWGTIGWSATALADTIPQLPPASVLNQPAPGRSATPQEWTALRTATSQTVALANGHFQTTVYAIPQYWQAPDGSWHTLHLQWQQHANGQWTTPAQPFALTFNPQAAGGPALTWQDGPHAVAMTWAHGAPVPSVTANGPQLSLPNVASGLSLTTRVTAGGVAQDWVLQSAPTAPITETVTLTDLTPGTPLASGAIMVGATVVVAGAYAGYQIYTANWGQSKTNNGKTKGKTVRGGKKSRRDQWTTQTSRSGGTKKVKKPTEEKTLPRRTSKRFTRSGRTLENPPKEVVRPQHKSSQSVRLQRSELCWTIILSKG